MDQKNTPQKIALRAFMIVIVMIFFVEIVVMGGLRLVVENDNIWVEMFLDAALLAVFQLPVLYYFMLRPIQREITERRHSENELRRAKEQLEFANHEVQSLLEREQVLARTDGLTGLYNHRHFFELAEREFEASVRYHRPLAVIVLDTDHLKWVNDTLGHLAGDKMLVKVAQTIAAQLRNVDVLARNGGDEFAILLPETSAQEAFHIAERIRVSVAAALLEISKSPLSITLSIGISELWNEPADDSIEPVVQRADKALYTAKETGRNRTMIYNRNS
jgi:diguanylate cyclase (GGDEF)-like protein